ncbi:hypothetical protein M569_08838, partial [Genlisea aurea]
MAEDFESAVEDGLRLSKRIYYGKDRAVAPPKTSMSMGRDARFSYLPTSPMMYAVISDPSVVDNPDMPSYQPHVHGRLDPPALLPLQMNGISLDVDCYIDTAFVTATGSWRVHCVMGSKFCDCLIAVPMGKEGSILGVEVEVPRKSFSTQIVGDKDAAQVSGDSSKIENGGFLRSNIFTLTIPQIDGGTNISVKLRWSQKLLFHDGEVTLLVPFHFPEYVTPAAKKISKREKISLNVCAGSGTELFCKTTSHPLKERQRLAGKLSFYYEADVLSWSSSDFMFTYSVSSSNHSLGGVILNYPSSDDVDQRDSFLCYIYPGKMNEKKGFRKEIVFAVDISGSMRGKPLEDTKTALVAALSQLRPEDSFNIIAFNGETFTYSSWIQPATEKIVEDATRWINSNFVASGGTNILLPLSQAVKMFSGNAKTIAVIFLVTDGTVEDERKIIDVMQSHLTGKKKDMAPRIYTLGIGKFCNNYFLRMLATIGRGHHEAVVEVDKIEIRFRRLFSRASSVVVANVSFENIDELSDLEVFPSQIPDISSESPLIVSGWYSGKFSETLRLKGIHADGSDFCVDLKAVDHGSDIVIPQITAKLRIELLTSQAWYSSSGNGELKHKVANLSIQNGVVSEYTNMVLIETAKA